MVYMSKCNIMKNSSNIGNDKKGKLVFSLDFELFWGMLDKKLLKNYEKNILGVYKFIPLLLKLFKKYKIHATWAVIGFLFFNTWEELSKNIPKLIPNYKNRILSSYEYFKNIRKNKDKLKFHFAPGLIELIQSYPNQEIATHTFSHYYCLEKGSNLDTFREDLKMFIKIAQSNKIFIKSIVFPRNQYSKKNLNICKELGIKSYRGNQRFNLFKGRNGFKDKLYIKVLNFLDYFFNILGHHAYSIDSIKNSCPVNITASRFIFWYSNKLKFLEPLRLRRIYLDMIYAAKNGLIFHIWGHPHNFGKNIKKNLIFFKKILELYLYLNEKYGFESLNMCELTNQILEMNNYK